MAAVLGFFFPWAGAFYTRKIVAGVVLLIIDVFFLALSLIGIGIPMLLLFGIICAFQSYKWAQQIQPEGIGSPGSSAQASAAHGLETSTAAS